jgi:hypothetical protein
MSSGEINQAQADLISLQSDEQFLGNVSFHWFGWWTYILAGLLLIPVFGIGLVILYLVYRAKKKSGCVVTSERIVHTKAGLLSAETIEVRMSDVRSISTFEGVFRGGVKVDTGAGEIAIGVTNPREMASVLREEKNRQNQ